jgi:hypothetical protein
VKHTLLETHLQAPVWRLDRDPREILGSLDFRFERVAIEHKDDHENDEVKYEVLNFRENEDLATWPYVVRRDFKPRI